MNSAPGIICLTRNYYLETYLFCFNEEKHKFWANKKIRYEFVLPKPNWLLINVLLHRLDFGPDLEARIWLVLLKRAEPESGPKLTMLMWAGLEHLKQKESRPEPEPIHIFASWSYNSGSKARFIAPQCCISMLEIYPIWLSKNFSKT